MPNGVQWTWEEVRNAKRAAEYLAEAQAEAQREEARRAEARARVAARQAERAANCTAYYSARPNSIQEEIKWNTGACRSARIHAADARAAKFGSKEYIMARYGYVCGEFGNSKCHYGTILKSLMTAEGLTEDQAWDRIVTAYTEERWKQCEAPFTEYFLNHVNG